MPRSFPAPSAGPQSLVAALRHQATRRPGRRAFLFLGDGEVESERLTYRELDRRARAMAELLQRQRGVGERVLLLFPPGLDLVAAFFGCLYAGAVAVPAYPPRSERLLPRLRAIARDAAPGFVLAPEESGRLRRAVAGLPELAGSRWLAREEGRAEDWREPEAGPETLAFLQYTSGSTSDPKGVMVTHGNLFANAGAITGAVGLDDRDVLLGWLPLYHDMGLIGIVIQTVLLGARCVLMSPTAFLQQPMRWPRAVARYGATLSGGPDFAWDLCARRGTPEEIAGLDLSRWRVAFNGAEPVRPETLDRFALAFAPAGFRAGALCPCYGLAEATLLVSVSPPGELPLVRDRNAGSGRIAPGTEVAIVQPRSRRRLEEGRVGEIWVSGPQVAAGYWGNPKETARTFRVRLDGRDWLRTGDLGFLDHGELFVAGRIKDLIVIRGRNLYPQDVERTAEASHPAFVPGGAAAFAVEAGGRERLAVALEVDRRFRSGDAGEAMAALRRAVAEEHEAEVWGIALLAPGMLPRTSSGKVRRRACRDGFLERTLSAVAWDTGGDPEDPGEPADLRGAVARALGREPSREDERRPLAALGLDSLGAIELRQALESGFGISLSLTELLEASLDVLAARAGTSPAPTFSGEGFCRGGACPRPGGGPIPSYGQRALWFLHRLDPEGTAYHVAFAARVRSGIDADRLRQAVAALASRHDALRTVYPELDGEPQADVREAAPEAFAVIEAPAERLAAEAARPFDLAAGPAFRVRLLLGPSGERALLVGAHHIAVDLSSLVVLMDELGRLLAGESLPPAPSFLDHAAAERERLAGPEGERLWDFWRERLGGRELPALDLPTDRPRPAVARFHGASLPLSVPPETTAALKALAAESGTTLFAVLLAAYQLLLARLSGQDEVLVGAPAAGRGRPELAGVVGYLVNPLVLRGSLEGEPTGRELLARARAEALGALEHQDLPFPLLVERLHPHRDAGRSPIFQALLALERPHRLAAGAVAPFVLGTAGEPLSLGPLVLEPLPFELPGAQLDLSLTLVEVDGGIAGRLRYDADLFDETTVGRWAACFGTLLEELAAYPEERAAELSLLSPEERRQLLGVEVPAPAASIYSRFEAWVERAPDTPALIWQGREVTYRELAERAGQIAAALAWQGIGPEDRVGVLLPRTPDLVAAILGVLRCGAAYLPLDPAYPAERIAWMAADAGTAAVITPEWLDRDLDGPAPPPLSAGPGGLFAVIYTSGSTGLPKGVAVEERSVAALLAWAEGAYSGAEIAGVLAATSVCFDLSVFELFVPLTHGGAVVLAENALELTRLPARDRVTLLNTVPSAAAELAGDLPSSVRTVNLAGEPIPASLARALVASGRRLLNLYGPTETTVYSTGTEIGMEEGAPPIGLPLPGERAVLLDRRLQPVAPGVPGEIWIGGTGLARGYLGRPDATADRFRPDPWGPPGARLYWTGDLARRMRDGRLAFLGRLDHQVKIRGFRVEPGEVEAALAAHPAVAEAAVAARPEPGGGRRLVAWVAPEGVREGDLRAHLETRLPAFLVPTAFVVLPRLPRTPNGKLDRKALPEPGEAAERTMARPRTPLEEVLAGMWAELLGREAGPDDDFFALGGHSLLAARLASRVRDVFGVELPLSLLFRAPTLRRLAQEVARLRSGGDVEVPPPVHAAPRSGALPLTFAQRRLWFLDRLEPGTPRYNVPVAVHFAGPLDAARLEGGLRELARRHEALRTRFHQTAEGPVQEIDPGPGLPLPRIDLAGLPQDRREAEAGRLARAEARLPFDLARGSVGRARLVRRGEEEHALLLVFHHIAVDAWSLALLLRELAALLREEPLPPPSLQITDIALWEREWMAGEALAARLEAGRARLAGVPDLALPADRPRPPVQSPRGGRRALALPAPSVADLGHRLGATPFMVLLAAFEAVLGRWTGQESFAVGSPVAGRDRVETETVVGPFVNTLALRADLAGEPSFSALVGRVREDALAAYADRDLPFERLVEALAPARDLSRSPLFQAMLSLVDVPLPGIDVPGLAARVEEIEAGVAKLDLTLELTAGKEGWTGSIEYSADLFDPATAGRLALHFTTLLAGALAAPDLPWTRLPLLGEGERHQLLQEWRWGPGPAAGGSVLPAIAEQAARNPGAPAVLGEEEVSRGELARRAGRLAGRLAARGAGPEVVVGVRIERSAELAVAVLAVLRAGGVLLPLDPAYPPERLAALLADAGARLLLVRAGDPPPPAGWIGETLAVEGDGEEAEVEIAAAVHPEQAAYVVYTSGSTGKPKGVVIPHRAVAILCRAAGERYGMTPDDRMLGFTSPAFDVMLEETLVAWASGAAVAPAPPGAVDTLAGFVDFLERRRVTIVDLPASFWHAWVSGLADNPPPPSLRVVVAGSERLAADKVAAWRRGTRVGLINAYGSTEAAVTLMAHDPLEGEDPVRVGRPLPRAEVLLLDPRGEPVPLGAAGEVAFGGPWLARGYLGRPDLTAGRFVPHPWGDPGDRLYRTGDLGRFRAGGVLDLLGRIDDQMKVRGVRIEPGEVEAALESHPEVARAAVAARPGSAGPRLVAWVVPRSGASPDPAALRAYLAGRLPEGLLPAAWVLLDALPLTPAGKVDRTALPGPDETAGSVPAAAPRTPVEAVLAGIWNGLLGRSAGPDDDFFALGGHSLLAILLVSRVREVFGVDLPLPALFRGATLARLAAEVERLRAGREVQPLPPLRAMLRSGPAPLSLAQRRLWFLDRLEPESPRYNVAAAVHLDGPLNPTALERALVALANRHESLRLRVAESADGPVQEIASAPDLPLPWVDLSNLPRDRREAEAGRLAREEARGPFDLARGPVLRARLLRRGSEAHTLLLVVHHIAVDGWSLALLLRELSALLRGEPLPPPPLQITDFALWQREWMAGEALGARLESGRARLAGVPDLALPADRPRPPVQSARGGRRWLALEAPRVAALEALGRRCGATPFMVLLAAFETLLGRWTGQEDFAVGSPVAGRDRVETEGVVGLFVNMLALRAGLAGEPAFSALVGRVREDALAAYADRDLPFERLVEALAPARDLSRTPLFQAMLSLLNVPLPGLDLPGLAAQVEEIEAGIAKLDLTLELTPQEGSWAGSLEYSADLFDPATAGRLAGHFTTLLAGALAAPDLPWTHLPLLGEGERHQLLHEWRWGPGPAAGDSVLPAIAEQAARDPGAPAVAGEEEISRGELARRAGRLAGRLAARGVGAERVVGVRVERSAELAVAVLAVLRSGGVLLPLDPVHPPERQAALLADAGARLLLVRAGDPPPPAAWTGETLAVDDPREEETEEVAAAIHPEQAAYVVYTSGSTGRPKGVVVPHRALAALCQAAGERYGMTPDDRMLGFTSPGFDVMLEESLVAWAWGAAVAPAPPGAVDTLAGFIDFLERRRVTIVDLPASFWHAWVSGLADNPPPPSLRVVVAGSERLAADKVATWRWGTRVGLINAYGSTEVAVTLVAHDPQEGEDPVRVGRPFPRAEVLLLDAGGEPVPLGAAGEVAFGGPWLARGYLGRPDLTAERFVPHPWGDPGSRLYRTGDLGRFRADGVLELAGRIDHQMKVRGVRIEPGEVEAALESHPEVARAAVAARPGSAGPRLVAWVVPRSGAAPDPAALRAVLAGRLPEGLVPTAWVFLETLPLTPAGKVDRGALPEPAPEDRPAPAAPRTAAEAVLAEVWSRALGVEPVGIHDDFFSLGGDSILTLQIVAGARARGLAITPRQLFELRTVAALAAAAIPARLEEQGEEDGGPFPLTPIQRWFFDLDQPEPYHFNQALLLMPANPLDPGVLAGAVATLVERHGALRLRFERGPEGWRQRVGAEERDLLTVVDLESLPEALTAAAAQAQTGFDLAAGPLFRAVLFRGVNRLLLAAHHLVVDGVSWRVLLEDLDRALQGLPLPPRTASFRRWARLLEPRAAYPLPWETGLEGQAGTVSLDLSPEDTLGLLRGVPAVFAGARPDEALLAALARASGGRLQVDVEGHGREAEDVDLSRTVGWFTVLRPVSLDLPPGRGPGEALRAVREGLRRELEITERPPVSFNYLGRFDASGPFAPAPESPGPQRSPAARRTHRLEVNAAVVADRLRIELTGDRADRAALEELAAALAREIDALLAPVHAWEDPEVEDLYPLTPSQQGILFHTREAPGSGAYVEQLAWTFAGGFDRAALERAWALVSERHAVLRTAFVEGEEPLQVVRRHAEPEWVEEDWRQLSPGEQEERLGRRMADDRRRGFDPERAPLQRFALFRLSEDRWRFLWSHHHLLLDGWSMALVLEEILGAYEAFLRGEEPSLPARRPFRDWVEELLRRDAGAEESFWRGLLAGFGEPTPLGIDRPARSGEEGWGERRLAVPADVARDLLALGRRRGWTPATLVHGAWALLLGAYAGSGDVVFGAVVSGRGTLPGAEGIVGLLANTLPVRSGLPAARPLGDWLDRLQALLVEIRQREATPLPAVRAWSEVPRDRPLFESLVAFENFPLGEPLKRWRGGSRIEDVIAADHTHYPLTLLAALDPDLSLTLLFARGRFEEAAIDRLEGHLGALLAGMAAGEEQPLSALSLLTPAEAAQIAAWTEGAPPEGDGAPVHRLFAAQAARTPEAVALISAGEEGARLTYRELEERSNRLARHLRVLGVGPEVPVALCVGRSLDAVVGLLAILKAGGFCVPLDAAYPRDRLALMLEDARPAALLTWERLAAELPPAAATVLLDDPQERAAIDARGPEPLTTPALPGSLAYVIYTSGSTGRPKGVAVFHRLLSNIVAWQMAAGAARGPRRTLQFSPWSFDVCLQEIFSTLGTGGALVLLAEEWRSDGPRLWRLIEEERIERLFIPFVALELLAESAPAGEPLAPGLAEIAAAGEQLQITPAVAGLFSRLPGCVLENHYGPTETHIVVTYTLTGPPESWPPLPPIGRAIAGARAAVLDDGLRPVPVGVVGDVCLGGIAVCRGYLGRPDLTAERFPPDPLSGEPGARLYRSGDLGRWREDGQIEFLGRRDGQVKVRGYRVELGEIEAVLATHPAVLRAAVVARKGPGGTRLLAAVVPRPDLEVEEAGLREFLRGRLPAYMVPAELVVLDELPLTPSGKVDRKALALLRTERPASTPPGTEIERDLAAIWTEVLGAPRVGLEDGFFELGGHSLLAGRLLARVRKAFGIDLSLASLLEEPTLGGMAAAVTAALAAREPGLDELLHLLDGMDDEEAERLLAAGGEILT